MRLLVTCMALVLTSVSAMADIEITMDRYACVAEPTSQTGLPVDFYGDLSNTGTSTVSLTCRLVTSQPSEWLPPGVCVGVSCFPSDMDFSVQLGPSAHDEIHLTFYPFDVAAKGTYWFRFADGSMADSIRIEVLSDVPSLVVDDDEGDDTQRFVERSIPAERVFLTWDQSLEPLAGSDIALLDRVVWITGSALAGCISEGEATVLTAFLEDGGKLLLSGQNALEGEAGAAFGQEELGAVVQSTSVESRRVEGAAGTSFEVVSFDIEGGDGANNQTAPDALGPTGLGFRALRYASGEVSAVARIGLGGRRSLACGFGVEACADSTALQQSLGFILNWLDDLVSGEDAPTTTPVTMRIGPNPARDIVSIDLAVAERTSVRIWLTDLIGRHVRDLYQGEWTPQPLRLPRLPDGVYQLRVQGPALHASRSLVILEETR